MKLFWTIIGVLTILAAGLVWARTGGGSDGSPDSLPEIAEGPSLPAPELEGTPIAARDAASTEKAIQREVADSTALEEVDASAESVEAAELVEEVRPEPADEPSVQATESESLVVEAAAESDSVGGESSAAAAAMNESTHDATAAADEHPDATAEPIEVAAALTPVEAAPTEAPAEEAVAGLVLSDRFTITGKGTAEAPFELPWALLTDAARTYNPRDGKTELPEWAQSLNGKHVRISGFLLFPLVVQDADELLVMQNQWDGCCIGIPPTPYDSVEVKLTRAVEGETWRFNYGAVTGTLNVDPYVVGKWLVGLYVIEKASLELEGM